MINYLNLVRKVLLEGDLKNNRTGIQTSSIFCEQLKFNMDNGFPIVTTRKTFFRGAVIEFIWMVSRGDTNIKFLLENNVGFWSHWPYKYFVENNTKNMTLKEFELEILNNEQFSKKWGDIGKGYGRQFRNWNGNFDQVSNLIEKLKKDPLDRKLVVPLFNPSEVIDQCLLAPCHYSTTWNSDGVNLNLNFNMRSSDLMCGLPINICFYALFLHVIAKLTNLKPNLLVYRGEDIHIYENHFENAIELVKRTPYELPTLEINPLLNNINNICIDDFKLTNYKHGNPLVFEVAV